MTAEESKKGSGIVYSHYAKQNREGEHFVPKHTLSFQLSGSLMLTNGQKQYDSEPGAFRLIRRNQLMRFVKQPPADGEFKSLTIYLEQQLIKDVSLAYGMSAHSVIPTNEAVIDLKNTLILQTYLESLRIYWENGGLNNPDLVGLKLKEGLLLVVEANPEVTPILFDFVEPHKIELEAFMQQHYQFNVRLERFAYLTGRSLATFKRDFETIFHTSPHRWLLQKRLAEAHYLIKEKGKSASDVYLDLGFEDLSHFSYVFKKQFGESPSRVSMRP